MSFKHLFDAKIYDNGDVDGDDDNSDDDDIDGDDDKSDDDDIYGDDDELGTCLMPRVSKVDGEKKDWF